MLSKADNTITSLYRASAGQEPWGRVLSRIVDDLGARGAQMVGINQSNRSISYSYVSDHVDCGIEVEYIRKYHALDPRIPRLISRPLGSWLYDEDEFNQQTFGIEPYYRDYMAPADARFTAAVRLSEDENDLIMMAVVMGLQSTGFAPEHRDYLLRIADHFTEALRIFRKTRQLAQMSSAGAELISRIKKPIFLIDPIRNITLKNSHADALLNEVTVLVERHGRLVATDALDERTLTVSVAELTHGMRAGKSGERRIVKLSSYDARRFAASLIAFDPPSSMHAFGPLPQIMVTIHGAPARPEPDVYLWQAAFDLTPAEARVAAEIFKGASVPAAAALIGISPNTVNAHLDSVFAKTHTNKQAELVRVLMLATD